MEEKLKRDVVKIKVSYLSDLWQDFCTYHTHLYELTCEEYVQLLESDLEKLDITIEQKKKVISDINLIDETRKEVVSEINDLLGTNITNISTLCNFLENNDYKAESDRIKRLNLILKDVILNIQEQNKKNQVYLNKALHSLRELKESFTGKSSYKTYGANGATKSDLGR